MPSSTEQAYNRWAARLNNKNTRKPQLPSTSLEKTDAINQYGDGDNTVLRLGGQYDGTNVAASLGGPTPPVPTGLTVTEGPLNATVRWSGTFADGEVSPMDLKQVEAVVDDGVETKIRAVLGGELGTEAVIGPLLRNDPETGALKAYSVWLQARTLSGKASAPSAVVVFTPKPAVEIINPDGSTATKLGEDETFLSVGSEDDGTRAAISHDGSISGRVLQSDEDPIVMGQPLLGDLSTYEPTTASDPTGILDIMPRGPLAFVDRDVAGFTFHLEEQALAEVEFEEVAGRAYRWTFEPLSVYVPATYGQFIIRYEYGGSRPGLNSPVARRITVRNWRADPANMATFAGSFVHMPALGTGTRTMRLIISFHSPDGTSVVFNNAEGSTMRFLVEDIGMRILETGVIRSDRNPPIDPTPPPPQKRNDSQVWSAQGVQTYIANGNKWLLAQANSRMYQGSSGYNRQNGSSTGNLRSMATFPSFTGALSGADIRYVRIEFDFRFWWWNSGGNAEVGLHGYNVIQGTFVNEWQRIGTWHFNKPGRRWIDVPQQYWDGFKNGTWKGVTLGPGDYRTNYGWARPPRIEIGWRK